MMTNKVVRIIAFILILLPSLMLAMSGIMKLSGAKAVVEPLTMGGFGNYIFLFGVIELVSVALLFIQKTYKIGFLLICCYLGGALAVELSAAQPPMAALLLTVLWIGVFLKDRSAFLPQPTASAE